MIQTNGDILRAMAEQQAIPERTIDQVIAALAQAKQTNADAALARLMLRHGRLSAFARRYIEREYPQ